jgi:hypothetical protein
MAPGPAGIGLLAWDPGTTITLSVGNLSPGLFDINEDSTEAVRLPPRKNPAARILLCGPSTYPDAVSSFHKVVSITDSWSDSVDPDTTRAFLRSILAGLEKSTEVATPSISR